MFRSQIVVLVEITLFSYSAEMFRIGEILIFLLFIRSIFLTHCDIEESCPKINTNQTCQFAEAGKPSIVVRSTAGRLGNALFSYIILLGFKVRYICTYLLIPEHNGPF